MGHCHRCWNVFEPEDMTICYHYDLQTVLAVLCDFCVRDWLEHEAEQE